MFYDMQSLSKISTCNQQQDITYFESLWSSEQQETRQMLEFLLSNWESLAPFLEDELQSFQDVLDCKIESVQHYEQLFPGLAQLIKRVRDRNEYRGDRRKVDLVEPATDLLLKHFIYDITTRSQRNGNYFVRDESTGTKAILNNYIARSPLYTHSDKLAYRWHNLFARIENRLDGRDGREDEFVREIEKERLVAVDCLGCCPFFYAGMNIKNPAVNSTQVVLLQSVSGIRELESQLKDEACWLLNGHGGVILFDCVVHNLEAFPVGDLMSLQLKEEIHQTITSYLQCIYPPVEAANFSVTFVPIVKNPLEGGRQGRKVVMEGSYETAYFQREFIEGVYVTRVKINPTVPERLYFWANDQRPIFPSKTEGRVTATPAREIARTIKRRFREYYVPEGSSDREERRFMSPRLSYFHEGECVRPQLGVQVVSAAKTGKQQAVGENFQFMSLVLARKCDLGTIKARLLKHGIACELESKFEQHRFKYALTSAVLYHNLRFDHLLATVAHKKEFEFGGRFITVLWVTPFVRLTERNARSHLPADNFNSIQNHFSKEFPAEDLRLWRYECEGETEFYFRTADRLQTIFLFYVLNHLGEKAILKNPRNFDKLSPDDVAHRFQLFYPTHQKHLEPALKAELKNKPQ